MICNYIYSNLHSFGANGPCNYYIELTYFESISNEIIIIILDVGT